MGALRFRTVPQQGQCRHQGTIMCRRHLMQKQNPWYFFLSESNDTPGRGFSGDASRRHTCLQYIRGSPFCGDGQHGFFCCRGHGNIRMNVLSCRVRCAKTGTRIRGAGSPCRFACDGSEFDGDCSLMSACYSTCIGCRPCSWDARHDRSGCIACSHMTGVSTSA